MYIPYMLFYYADMPRKQIVIAARPPFGTAIPFRPVDSGQPACHDAALPSMLRL
jgi:hypothetical protein